MKNEIVLSYLRKDKLPHIWCPGCGHGIILGSLIRAIDKLKWERDNIALISGIGCSGRTPGYVDCNTLHTTHGRSLGFATGLKFSNPKLNVISVMGDGDSLAIGGNHFIHACRRNVNVTAIIFNNFIYGMTGGQFSPTTPIDSLASTSPYGNIDNNFNIIDLAIGAGIGFAARGSTSSVPALDNLIKEALAYDGFSVIEAISFCHVQYGKRNKMKTSKQMLSWLKDITIPKVAYDKLSEDEKKGKFPLGIFLNTPKMEYSKKYEKYIMPLAEKAAKDFLHIHQYNKAKLYDL